MKIFADLHHSGLYNSLKLLLEDRLGHTLYRPIGMEWFENGYWDIARPYRNSIDTVKQYLDLDQRYTPIDGTVPLNQIKNIKPTHYEIYDANHCYTQKALTWEQFQATDIDVIIGSIPDHWNTYTKLRDIYKPHAKVVAHMGNMFDEVYDAVRSGTVANLLASTSQVPVASHVNACFYHQEFPLSIFQYKKSPLVPIVKSFVHLFPRLPDYPLYLRLKELMPEYIYENYGALCDNGNIDGIVNIALAMQSTGWVMHLKAGGDGYGHILFNSAASGRPLIVRKEYYEGRLGEKLMIDGETCIVVDGKSVKQIAQEIRTYSEPTAYIKLCNNVYQNFISTVDFEADARKVKDFLSRLV